jgi:beta-glucosidase
VTGPGATSLVDQYGSWTFTWQGTDTAMYPKNVKTLLDAIRERAPSATYVQGMAAVDAARNADVVIVCLAEPPAVEKPGDIDDLTMPADQLQLARAIEATGTPVVLSLFHQRPRIIRTAVDSARAIVTGYQTGPFGGEAVAGVLFGDVNPSGRLPFTWPSATGALVHYDHAYSEEMAPIGYHPEWDFGSGLSYTTFTYADLSATLRDSLRISVTVSNTGTRAGAEVVQLYLRQLYSRVAAPAVRKLKAFQRIAIGPGEKRTVTFAIAKPVENGPYDALIGSLAARFMVQK